MKEEEATDFIGAQQTCWNLYIPAARDPKRRNIDGGLRGEPTAKSKERGGGLSY